jgi:hypothetical protein
MRPTDGSQTHHYNLPNSRTHIDWFDYILVLKSKKQFSLHKPSSKFFPKRKENRQYHRFKFKI